MYRRQFLKASALIGGGLIVGTHEFNTNAQQSGQTGTSETPIRITLGGYGPSTSSFSQGLKQIGDRLGARFGDDVEIEYLYNILDLGYEAAGDLTRLVDNGVLSLAYLTMSDQIPALEVAALPFLFANSAAARVAMDGALGQSAINTIEADTNFRVLGRLMRISEVLSNGRRTN